jgi:segregation and condensation protein B
MTGPAERPEPAPTPKELGEALAAQLGDREWRVDAEEGIGDRVSGIGKAEEETTTAAEASSDTRYPIPDTHSDPVPDPPPLAEAAVEPEVPPAPLQIIEAMLFIGGPPLKAERAGEVVRGLTPEQFRESVEVLNRVYRLQNRPYHVTGGEQGYALTVRPRYRGLREKIFGGPREARLTQAALDVLALVAYRQPAAKAEIDSVRGAESGSVLRQLVRLGLIAVVQRAEAKQREVCYGTTPRFLELFNLRSLDDLPQTGDPQRL